MGIGTEAGPDVDLIEVRLGQDSETSTRLWRGAQKDGLSGTPPALFTKYKDQIEKTAKKLGL